MASGTTPRQHSQLLSRPSYLEKIKMELEEVVTLVKELYLL